jgi:glucose-6-phosphate isomerase
LIELQDAISVSLPKNTMVVISSKSFDTPEILKNANHAKDWLHDAIGKSCWNNICGISSNKKGMSDFGIKTANQFEILNSVGGRYSIWSSMGLPAIFDMGWDNFEQFKGGAFEADQHFIKAPWSKNIPVMMALINCWNTNGLKINNLGIFTYNFKIRSLTKYLSQMGMESNGKSTNNQNNKSQFNTCPLIWGGYGPEAQHSVFQWLLQGTDYSACDFIGIKKKAGVISSSYQMMLAQITALSLGKKNEQHINQNVQGNNPISLLAMNDLSPKNLGFLIACYEHKVFVESQIYGINPFDQWGVQLAKSLTEESNRKKDFMKNFFGNKFLT